MRNGNQNLLTESVSAFFIFLFVYTAVSKLTDLASFRAAVSQSQLLEPFVALLSWGLPVTELLVASLLFRPHTRRLGLWCAFVLMVAFTGYVGLMLMQSETLPCTCGGIISSLSWPAHFWLNIGLSLMALAGLLYSLRSKFLLQ